MYSLRAALAALDVDGLLGAFGAPLLARAPERFLRPDEEEDDRLRRERPGECRGDGVGGRRRRVQHESVRPWSRVPRNCVRFARRSARAFVESSESIDPARFRAMAVFCEREA